MPQARSQTLVLVVDDHPVVISGCTTVLAADKSIRVIAADTVRAGFAAYSKSRPDISVIDINLPDLSGFELLRLIRKADPAAAVIMLSMNDDPAFVLRATEFGASGYVSKSDHPKQLLAAVQALRDGARYISPQLAQAVAFSSASVRSHPASHLTARELEVLRLLARGNTIEQTAKQIGLSYKTVANLTSLLKQKLDAKSHSDLIRIAVEMNLT